MENITTLLLSELRSRQRKNPRFSLRAFARMLDMSPSHLSHLINGKKPLSLQQAGKIADKLSLSPGEAMELAQGSHPVLKTWKRTDAQTEAKALTEEEFQLVADWSHFAILSLGQLKDNRANARWIAERLGIGHARALDAFRRLQSLGLIEIAHGQFRQTGKALTTSADVPSGAIRAHHGQNLELAAEKLGTVDVKEREFTSITFAMNAKKIAHAKKLIREFRERLCSELEDQSPTDVYTLAVQLFPLTQRKSQ